MSNQSAAPHQHATPPGRRLIAALRWIAPSFVAAIVAVSMLTLLGNTQSLATAQARAASGNCCVAVIDVNRVLLLLDERQARESELEALDTEQRRRIEAMVAEFRAIGDELEVLPQGPERRTKAEEAARLRARIETEGRFAELLIRERMGLMLAELFDKIEQAATEYAARDGYAIVISSDKTASPPEGATAQQVNQFLSNRRVLFAADGVDISQQVAAMMNNNYRMRNDNR